MYIISMYISNISGRTSGGFSTERAESASRAARRLQIGGPGDHDDPDPWGELTIDVKNLWKSMKMIYNDLQIIDLHQSTR